jgi:hypothetical protein
MAFGFRVRHPVTGAIKLDGTKRILIMAGTITVPAQSQGQVVSDVFLRGVPFCFCSGVRADASTVYPAAQLIPPQIGFNGNVMTYNNLGGAHRLMYGSW